MKLEQDLRIAIKSAASASRNQSRAKSEKVLIEEWMKKHPTKATKARALAKAIQAAESAEQKAREQLEKQFGLNLRSWRGELSIGNERNFQKVGGDIGTKRPQFSENEVIAEYVAARTKAEAAAVLAKYGIVWN